MTPVWVWATAAAVFAGLLVIALMILSPAFTTASRRRIQDIELYLGAPSPMPTSNDGDGPGAVGMTSSPIRLHFSPMSRCLTAMATLP